jgi:hypothetical protein
MARSYFKEFEREVLLVELFLPSHEEGFSLPFMGSIHIPCVRDRISFVEPVEGHWGGATKMVERGRGVSP